MVGSFSFSIRLPFPMVSFFGYWGPFRFRLVLMAGFFVSVLVSSVVAHPSLRSVWMGGLRDSLFVLRSGWSSVFPLPCSRFVLSARSFALRSPSFPMVPVSPRFSFPLRLVFHPLFFPSFFPMVSVFSLIPFKALLFFFFVPFFRLFALGSTSFPFPFSLIRPALPFISFVVFGFLSASLHRDAPSGGGDERAAWPRPTPSASVRPSRRTGRAWSRCRCVACWRRPCPGPGPA